MINHSKSSVRGVGMMLVVAAITGMSLTAAEAFRELSQTEYRALPKAERLAYNRALKQQIESTHIQTSQPESPTRRVPRTEPTSAGKSGGVTSAAATSTIQYDTGVFTASPTITSFCYGNQFNTNNGVQLDQASVTALSAFIATGAGTDNVFISVFGPVSGTTAPVLGSVSAPLNNGDGAFNTLSFGTPHVISGDGAQSFLAGVWYIAGDTVGLDSGTVGGQGHHGMIINDIVGTGFATLPGQNAIVRAKGSFNAVGPPELIEFKTICTP